MKEEDAKGKVCKRVILLAVNGEYTGGYVEQPIFCVVSNCMMWRWNPSYTKEDIHTVREKQGVSIMEARDYCNKHFTDMTTGYCGLVGKE